jgi:hypothetical protein
MMATVDYEWKSMPYLGDGVQMVYVNTSTSEIAAQILHSSLEFNWDVFRADGSKLGSFITEESAKQCAEAAVASTRFRHPQAV